MRDSLPARWQGQLPGGDRISVLVRAQAINLLLNDEHPSYTFDPAGRLHGAFQDGRNYRRSLDNRVLSKWTVRQDGRRQRQRRWLDAGDSQRLVDGATELARRVVAAGHSASAPAAVQTALDRLAGWDWAALEADRRRFQQIYTPVSILPPDQYLALVLQATHGCTHNACTFCTFYREIPFRIKSPEEFRSHVAAVLDFFGPALAMRRSLFLADANALVIPMPRLLALLEIIQNAEFRMQNAEDRRRRRNSQLPINNSQLTINNSQLTINNSQLTIHNSQLPIHNSQLTINNSQLTINNSQLAISQLPLFAFIDAFHVHRKSVADWQELRGYGLRRVYIGMESGHDPLLSWLNKPGQAADVLDAAETLKAAGIAVSVIIMLGVGGQRYAAGHVEDTAALLNAMPLSRGDLIYFSDFVETPGAPYHQLAAAAGVRPLDYEERRGQESALRQATKPRDPANPPQFSRYDINEFLY